MVSMYMMYVNMLLTKVSVIVSLCVCVCVCVCEWVLYVHILHMND